MKKTLIFSFIFILIYTLYPINVLADDQKEELAFNINSPSAVLMEYTSGQIIYAKQEERRMYPASMTKMMSMYLLLECIERKTHSFDDIVTVSSFASSMGGSQIFLKENERMSFEDLFTAVSVASANDAVVALAEHTYGSVEIFIDKMNEKAKLFGMNNTNFVNTTGFHDENHYTTAYDMSLLSRKLLTDYKDVLLKYTSIYETYLREDTKNPFWLVTTNKLLNTYEGMDGLKTGYTSESGYNLSATASRNNMRFIAIVMGGATSKSRNADITTLLNYGFNSYKSVTLYKQNDVIREVIFSNSKEKITFLISKEDINVILKRNENIDKLTINIDIFDNTAPKSKDTIIGKLLIQSNGTTLAEYNLYPKDDITKLTFWDILYNYLKILI